MRRPLAGFGFWPRRVRPCVGGVLRMLRRRRMIRCPRHGLYQPWWLARVPMGPWSRLDHDWRYPASHGDSKQRFCRGRLPRPLQGRAGVCRCGPCLAAGTVCRRGWCSRGGFGWRQTSGPPPSARRCTWPFCKPAAARPNPLRHRRPIGETPAGACCSHRGHVEVFDHDLAIGARQLGGELVGCFPP